ncbi:MAG: fibronectin type III domain-containing protein [Actinomycetota bacterium]|nr:fibronectin type III domain-containing protein [Actinomycetota bacterium]
MRRFARTPGRITGLRARTIARTRIELDFKTPGTDGTQPPPVRRYLVKQSLRPIRDSRDFARAQTLCQGSCRFAVSEVGDRVSLKVRDLRPRTTYYYAVSARDNVSGRPGPRSRGVTARTG